MQRRHRLARWTPSFAHCRGRRPVRTTTRSPGLCPAVTDATACGSHLTACSADATTWYLPGRRDRPLERRDDLLARHNCLRGRRDRQLDRHSHGYSPGPARLGGAISRALDVPLLPPPRHSPTSLQTAPGATGTAAFSRTLARPSEMRRRHRLARPTPSSAHRRPGRTTTRAPAHAAASPATTTPPRSGAPPPSHPTLRCRSARHLRHPPDRV